MEILHPRGLQLHVRVDKTPVNASCLTCALHELKTHTRSLRRTDNRSDIYLLQPSPLLLLLLDAFLPLGQQLALVLLVLLLLELLAADQLRTLLIGQLEAQEVPPQSGLAGDVDDGAGEETQYNSSAAVHGEVVVQQH